MPSSGQSDFREFLQFGVFHIPEYQRYYSWEESEREDLWTDLTTVPEDRSHYFGTFIVQDKGKKETVETGGYTQTKSDDIYYLIDGQQRLTTIALLATSITEQLEKAAERTDKASEKIREDAEDIRKQILVDEGLYQVKLLDQKEDDYFRSIVDGDSTLPDPSRPSQNRLKQAKKEFDDKLGEKRDKLNDDLMFARWCRNLWENTVEDLEAMVYLIDSALHVEVGA